MIGRIVHYRIGGTDESPELRPALVVRDWGSGCVNLQVFLDGNNDRNDGTPSYTREGYEQVSKEESASGSAWRTSRTEGGQIGQWRWPVRVSA